ncbi:MAG: Uma2 family endonuclease [Microcystaceae cyanobacterium]
MVAQVQTRTYSPEEYLAIEVESKTRNEYINGEIIPIAGGMPNHNRIVLNIASTFNFAFKKQPYEVFASDQRLWIPSQRIYTYPDVMVVSGDLILQEGRKDTITNPTLIIEVLSKSTVNYDQTEKFAFYRTIAAFQEYLLIDQYGYSVRHYIKMNPKKWEFQEYDSLEEQVDFRSVPSAIALTEIYDKVELEQ